METSDMNLNQEDPLLKLSLRLFSLSTLTFLSYNPFHYRQSRDFPHWALFTLLLFPVILIKDIFDLDPIQ